MNERKLSILVIYTWQNFVVMPIIVESLPIAPLPVAVNIMDLHRTRSKDAEDYQDLPQAIGVMSKEFADGFVIPLHRHERDQLLYAAIGIMRLRTEREAWIVPPDGAVYIPAGTPHSVSMHGAVDMRTLYIACLSGYHPHPLYVVCTHFPE